MKREAHFGKLFRHWLKTQKTMPSAAFELKQTTTNSIPFSDVKEHQIDALLAANKGCILYKIDDQSAGFKPFDYFYLTGAQSYVVIKYPGRFYGIDITQFILEKQESKRKSLTKERAREIASFSVQL